MNYGSADVCKGWMMTQSKQDPAILQMTHALTEGDRIRFTKAMQNLLSKNADLRHNWRTLVEPLLAYGELDLAMLAIDHYCRWTGDSPYGRFEKALVFARSGRHSQALSILDSIIMEVPDEAAYCFLRGTLALNLGDLPTAREFLLRTLSVRPFSGQAAYSLSALGSMAIDEEAANRLLNLDLRIEAAPRSEQAMLLYALGKVHADIGDIDTAFDRYSRAAAVVYAERRYDPTVDRHSADQALTGWSATKVAQLSQNITPLCDRPIFVTGLPRSGTTLVEQILVSHSAVREGDELGLMPRLVNEIGGPMASSIERIVRDGRSSDVISDFMRLLDIRFDKGGRVIDKSLEATRYLGIVAVLLPDAPIVYVRRRPLARAWSSYSTYFMEGLGWSFDQQAIAAHFRLEEELVARWQDILGDRLLMIDYESLVSDKKSQIPRIFSHVGLEVEPQTFSPEATVRLVRTASVAQVRSPIDTSRVNAAEPYRRHLQPFIDAYTAAGGTID